MNWHHIFKSTQKLVVDNAPVILTAIGVTGTITTAYLTGKASFKASYLIHELEHNVREGKRANLISDVTNRERVELVWKLYIPAVGVGAFTVLSIVFANRIGTRRAAAMAVAYSLSEKALLEYKDKVVETFGQHKEQKIRDEIAQDRVLANPVGNQQVIVTGTGDVLCMDAHSGRYFQSSMETMKKAQNDTNYEVLNNGYASLSDFYNRLGLANTKVSDDMGWNSDKLLELTFSTTMSDEDRPCIVMDFSVAPVRNFFRTH